MFDDKKVIKVSKAKQEKSKRMCSCVDEPVYR